MEHTVRVLGLDRPGSWRVTGLPRDPAAREDVVRAFLSTGTPPVCVREDGDQLVYAARPAGSRPPTCSGGPEVHLLTVSGPDAGRLVPVPPEGVRVGRGGSDLLLEDPAAPSRPLLLRLGAEGVSVTGEGDARPRAWDGRGPLQTGDTALALVRGSQAALAPPAVPPEPTVALGSPPGEQSLVVPLVTAGAPLVLGVGMAVATGSPLFLLFSLVSALAVSLMALQQRRAHAAHREALATRAEAVAADRRAACADPGDVARAVRSRETDRLGVGGGVSGGPALHWGEGTGPLLLDRPGAAGRWDAAVRVRQPALTLPRAGVPTHLVGPARVTAPAVRWALVQLLRHAVAAGVGLVERTEEGDRLWWAAPPQASAPPLVLQTAAPTLLASAHRVWADAVGLDVPPASMAPTDPVVRCEAVPSVPEGDVVDPAARTVRTADGRLLEDVVPTGIAERTLEWWLTELADDVHRLGLLPGSAATSPLHLPDQVGQVPAVDALAARLTSAASGATEGRGDLVLDLVADGPHLLIAGTTGSGKSDLLLSLLVGLVTAHPPAEAALILLDFKGGASFGPLAGLPHTMSLETNHVGATSLRTLQAIRAELRRRETLFAAVGVPDYPAYRRLHPDAVLPRLVVAVDELRVLVDGHPDAAGVLERLAATGRSLGFHLVLATQRATGAVTAEMRSNLGATIALRTATEQESWDLIGSAAAHALDPARPGSAVLSRPGRPDTAFRAAAWASAGGSPRWRRLGDAAGETPGSDWAAVAAELTARYAVRAWPRPARVVSPPLPPHLALAAAGSPGDGVLALLDDAPRARHEPWEWPPGVGGGTAWIIEPGGGRAAAASAVVEVARRCGDVLLLDGTGELAEALASPAGAHLLTPDGEDAGTAALTALRGLAASGGTCVVTGWAGWSGLRAGPGYRTFEEELVRWLGTREARPVRVGALGGRDLATSRLLLHLPHRFYVPAGTSAEHRLVWPRLAPVEPLPGRAVYVSPDHPEPGIPTQLAVPAAPDARPADASGPPSTL